MMRSVRMTRGLLGTKILKHGPRHWQVMRSETKGFPYWYNRITGESRWTQPHDSLETINSKSHVSMPEDRTWFNYQVREERGFRV
jgi:hypothetical protein